MQSRRNQLEDISSRQVEHAGLWFDKYLKEQLPKNEPVPSGDSTPQQKLVEQCATIKEPAAYEAFYQRWKTTLASLGVKVVKEAEVQGRMAVGLGDESIVETAITLHHTYGTPYIPGSALKGLAAAFAHQRLLDETWLKTGEAHQYLFGATGEAGLVTFFDALYVPGSGVGGQALYPDVITVHHQNYYDGKGAPTDWDNPNPVPFLSATGRYLVALTGPDDEWVEIALRILGQALQDMGVGAKTSSGYGRLHLVNPLPSLGKDATAGNATVMETNDPDQQIVESFKQRLAALPNPKVAGEINRFVSQWLELEVSESARQEIACAILAKIREAGRENKSKKKAWYQELLASVPEDSAC